MDKPIELAHELKKELDSLPLFIEYKRVKSLVDNSEELKQLKKNIALSKSKGDNARHKQLLDTYNNHPLIQNYECLKTDVASYLKEVSEIINKK